jgi:sugar phosphate isomerase/epimerase
MFDNDWSRIGDFLHCRRFDGFELYPVGDYPFECIPPNLICGLHLRFFVLLRQIWQGNRKELNRIFGSLDNVRHFYGGIDRQRIIDVYREQFELAHRLDCEYVVFHPAHCELEYIYTWNFPYSWQNTLDLCAEVINESLRHSRYKGLLLFENLWWPGSFRLNSIEEYTYLRQQVDYEHCGIVLDTGHLLAAGGGFERENDAVIFLLKRAGELAELRGEIQAVHLCCSLSGEYIRNSRAENASAADNLSFWPRLRQARRHVSRIDTHDPFSLPTIGKLLELLDPRYVVFEFTFRDLAAWQKKINTQQKALEDCLW